MYTKTPLPWVGFLNSSPNADPCDAIRKAITILSCGIHSLRRHLGTAALAAGTIMNNLMSKEIAVNAKVVLARRALVPTANTHAFGMILCGRPLVLGWYCRERQAASEANRARGIAPRYLDPIHQGEQVVVGARKMSGKNQRKATRRTLGGQTADFAPAARTQISSSRGLRVACAKGRAGLHGT